MTVAELAALFCIMPAGMGAPVGTVTRWSLTSRESQWSLLASVTPVTEALKQKGRQHPSRLLQFSEETMWDELENNNTD